MQAWELLELTAGTRLLIASMCSGSEAAHAKDSEMIASTANEHVISEN